MMEEYFNTLLQETERRMAAAAAGMEGKETVATCRETRLFHLSLDKGT